MNTKIVIDEMKKVICGKDDVIEKMLMCIVAGGHVIMEDIPGTGKTTMAKAFAKVLGLASSRLQFTSDVMPSDITGYLTFDKASNENRIVKGPIFNTNIFLADEINRASSKSQAALLEVMEEYQCTISGTTFKVDDLFCVIGTMNPYVNPLFGISVLPQSQLDRFMMALSVGYAGPEGEKEMMKARDSFDPLDKIQAVTSKEEILAAREEIKGVHVDDSIYDYIIALADATRKHPEIQVGISPRTELALARLSKTKAFFTGRSYVVPEDVASVFIDACIHKITLNSQELTVISDARRIILEEISDSVKKPHLLKKS